MVTSAPLDVQELQELRNRRDFVGFLGHRDLAQTQMVGRGPGTDQVQSLLTAAARATERLAVDGDLVEPQSIVQGLHPFAEASLESRRLELIEHALEGIMGRRLLRQA